MFYYFKNFTSMFITFVSRERCLKILKYALVFFLCKKTERFLLFFHNYFSRFDKIKSRTYITNMRQFSLQMDVFCMHVQFHVWEMIIKGVILAHFHIPECFISLSIYQCLCKYYIIIPYSLGYLMIQNRLQSKRE